MPFLSYTNDPLVAPGITLKFGVWASRNLDWFHQLINLMHFQEYNQVDLQVPLSASSLRLPRSQVIKGLINRKPTLNTHASHKLLNGDEPLIPNKEVINNESK